MSRWNKNKSYRQLSYLILIQEQLLIQLWTVWNAYKLVERFMIRPEIVDKLLTLDSQSINWLQSNYVDNSIYRTCSDSIELGWI